MLYEASILEAGAFCAADRKLRASKIFVATNPCEQGQQSRRATFDCSAAVTKSPSIVLANLTGQDHHHGIRSRAIRSCQPKNGFTHTV
jgi:hypothetical protein